MYGIVLHTGSFSRIQKSDSARNDTWPNNIVGNRESYTSHKFCSYMWYDRSFVDWWLNFISVRSSWELLKSAIRSVSYLGAIFVGLRCLDAHVCIALTYIYIPHMHIPFIDCLQSLGYSTIQEYCIVQSTFHFIRPYLYLDGDMVRNAMEIQLNWC